MTDAIVSVIPAPKYMNLFREALSLGYSVDPEIGKAYRPDGSDWPVRIDRNGYPSIQASICGKHLSIPLHKAVAYVLWGAKAFGGVAVHVRHLDANKLNCRAENLALGTARDNVMDKPAAQRSNALRKRAETLGKERLSEIASRSAATRGRDVSVICGRMSGALRKKLTPDQVMMVRENASKPAGDRISQRKLAAMLGVKQGTICDIIAGRCYGDVNININRTGLGEY